MQTIIDRIWASYDIDGSGALNHEEAKKFLEETSGGLNRETETLVSDFLAKDKSGSIEKEEIFSFLKQLTANSPKNNDIEKGFE